MTTALYLATLIPAASQYASSSTTATGSLNLLQGANGSLPYQTAAGNTAFLPVGGNGTLLTSNGLTPVWQNYTGTSQIAGGGINTIVYQTAPNTTGFITQPTTASTVLTYNGSGFSWSQAGTANNVAGGGVLQILYQSAPSATAFIPTPSTASTYLIYNGTGFVWTVLPQGVAANIGGGGLNTIPYQVATSSTSYIPGPSTASTFLFWSGAGFTYTNVTYIPTLGVGIGASGVAGEIRATNQISGFYTSDIQFKENIQDIPNALETVKTLGGKLFDWTDSYIQAHGGADGYFVRKEDFGLVAQDVQRVFPRAGRTREDGTLALDYAKLCAVAFAAIKELSDKLDQYVQGK